MGVFAAALLLAAGTAAVCGVLLLAQERIAATRSVAIRAALGIDRWPLLVQLARGGEARGRRAGTIALGVALACAFTIMAWVLAWTSLLYLVGAWGLGVPRVTRRGRIPPVRWHRDGLCWPRDGLPLIRFDHTIEA